VSFSTDVFISTLVSASQFTPGKTERIWQWPLRTIAVAKTYFGLAGRRGFLRAVQKNKRIYTVSMPKLLWKEYRIIH